MPDTIVRSFRKPEAFAGSSREFLIYTKAEADAEGIEYVSPWYLAKGGDWVLTDDGFVMQCVRRDVMKPSRGNRHGGYKMNFTGGMKMVDPRFVKNLRLEWKPYRDFPQSDVNYSAHRPQSHLIQWVKRPSVQNALDFYVEMWFRRGGRLTKEDYKVMGRLAAPADKKPLAKAKWMMKKRYIQEILMKKLAAALTGLDVNYETIVKNAKDAIELAKDTGKPGDMLKGNEFLLKLVAAVENEAGNMEKASGRDERIEDADWTDEDIQERLEKSRQSTRRELPIPDEVPEYDVNEETHNEVLGTDEIREM